MKARVLVLASLVLAVSAPSATAQAADSAFLSVDRIFGSREFAPEPFGPARWIMDGSAYTTLEQPAAGGPGKDIVHYDTRTGTRTVLVSTAGLTPAGDSVPLAIDDYQWSDDREQLLVFTNSERVWRTNTRGDYWVLERASGQLRKLGGPAAPSTLMFAKFSPDARHVGYVREHNLYVEDLRTGTITQLTTDGSRTIINGTFDWVYEEELGLQDGWRWSPDGQWIAYWQLDAAGVRDFNLINTTDSMYAQVTPIQYPKAGEVNSAGRIGVVPAAGGETRWFDVPGDPRNTYLARMEWAANSTEVVMQRLNRLQNTNELLLGDAATGRVSTILADRDSSWVETVDDFRWLDDGKRFLWVSERDGWTHAYAISRDGSEATLLTPGAFDVLNVIGVDPDERWLYYIASPDNPAQRYLFRTRLNGTGKAERLSPANLAGSHSYNVSPNRRWAFHTYSTFDTPPVITLVRLPDHQTIRPLAANDALADRVALLERGPHEFFTVDVHDGVGLNGWIMKPPGFDATRAYPVLFYVYGGPGSQTVRDSWGGSRYLWHLMLTQQGIAVASIDNRGTGARGREWRKIVYGQLGVIETQDQAAAARIIGRWPFVDSTRMAIWGWSYGGFMSLNALFQHPDVYHAAVAVAPVTHWKFYDTIYTERYNGLPQDNADGYDRGSPLSYVDKLRGNLLLVHGTGDDNVHFQNSEALINELIAADKQFSLMIYPNRTHGIFGGNSQRHLFRGITRYLEAQLRPTGPNGDGTVSRR
ncbi:MAG TPA: S9 family peptidase [Gemmatimonadales bacterium]|nr:S9 family peptidase [Gemmatimonadales bacterium]